MLWLQLYSTAKMTSEIKALSQTSSEKASPLLSKNQINVMFKRSDDMNRHYDFKHPILHML